jgi:leader peptidase (prepilin peptidase) / N-methyltransferase
VSPALVAACAAAGLLGLVVGAVVNRLAGRFPWPAGAPLRRVAAGTGPVAVRRPLVEAATAALFVLVAAGEGISWQVPAFLVLAAAGVLLVLVDLRHRLLPDRVVVPTLVAGVVLLSVAALAEGTWPALLRALLGAAALFAAYLVLALVSPGGLGMGDVKLAAVLGLFLGWLGWGAVLVGAVAGFVVQAVFAVVLLALRRARRDSELPFGPAMLVGAALTIALTAT